MEKWLRKLVLNSVEKMNYTQTHRHTVSHTHTHTHTHTHAKYNAFLGQLIFRQCQSTNRHWIIFKLNYLNVQVKSFQEKNWSLKEEAFLGGISYSRPPSSATGLNLYLEAPTLNLYLPARDIKFYLPALAN